MKDEEYNSAWVVVARNYGLYEKGRKLAWRPQKTDAEKVAQKVRA